MKPRYPVLKSRSIRILRRVRGFTIPEVLVAMAVFILVIAGVLGAHLYGLKMFEIDKTKLITTGWSRSTFGRIADEIHSCYRVQVGDFNVTNEMFTGLLDGERQEGSGLMIYPTEDTNSYVLYFVQPVDQTFRRTTGQPGTAMILAGAVSNTVVFSACDFSGDVLTNKANNPVIHVDLDFYQPAGLLHGAYYYRMNTAVARHAIQ